MALVGGSWALAAFQLKPPLGRSIVEHLGWPTAPPRTGPAAGQSRAELRAIVSRSVAVWQAGGWLVLSEAKGRRRDAPDLGGRGRMWYSVRRREWERVDFLPDVASCRDRGWTWTTWTWTWIRGARMSEGGDRRERGAKPKCMVANQIRGRVAGGRDVSNDVRSVVDKVSWKTSGLDESARDVEMKRQNRAPGKQPAQDAQRCSPRRHYTVLEVDGKKKEAAYQKRPVNTRSRGGWCRWPSPGARM